MDDFAEDFKVIDERLSILETKQINSIDLQEECYNPNVPVNGNLPQIGFHVPGGDELHFF